MSLIPTSNPVLWKESPELREGPVARVAILAAIEGEYSFAVPDALAGEVEPGRRLLVPFGKGGTPREALCLAVAREPWLNTLRPVAAVVDDRRLLDDQLLELGRWMARYYCCPLGRTLSAMLPEAVRERAGYRTVRRLRIADRGLRMDGLSDGTRKRSAKREAIRSLLREHPDGLDLDELVRESGASKSVVTAMVQAGQLLVETRRVPADAPDFDRPIAEPDFELNPAQQAAIRRIDDLSANNEFRAVLLFGVSGSGKTEVYIRSIRAVVARGRQAILLVPEIALTTQLVDRLAGRFRDVAVVHSGLTGAQRSRTWSAIAAGRKKVVIGTRSAVFAPCPNLGLIVVDEEQEGSYKNQQSPRFHTRDVAVKRAQLAHVPVVLGSATPSLETWWNCERLPHFERITLPERIAGLALPAVAFVDMRAEARQRPGGIHLLSRQMEHELAAALDSGKQAVLLLNRRGFASYLVCGRCRTPVVCPHCRVNMVFHKTIDKALCHYCSARMIVPRRCGDASCGGTLIRFGMGTQRVEQELREKFPRARLARADSDTMTRVSVYEQVLRDFLERKLDILLGTQMIAKGLDFPGVSFVGVVNADTSLSAPDFRAAERTFQLVTQVAGRAGRAESGGRVVVQSLLGQSATLQFAARHDYPGFAAHELVLRRSLNWPPVSRIARVVVSLRSESQARREAHRLADLVRRYAADENLPTEVLGPQSAPLSRLRNLYRYDFLIRCPNAARLMDALNRLRDAGALVAKARSVTIDVDPVSLL